MKEKHRTWKAIWKRLPESHTHRILALVILLLILYLLILAAS